MPRLAGWTWIVRYTNVVVGGDQGMNRTGGRVGRRRGAGGKNLFSRQLEDDGQDHREDKHQTARGHDYD
jgi:hypothetical protein